MATRSWKQVGKYGPFAPYNSTYNVLSSFGVSNNYIYLGWRNDPASYHYFQRASLTGTGVTNIYNGWNSSDYQIYAGNMANADEILLCDSANNTYIYRMTSGGSMGSWITAPNTSMYNMCYDGTHYWGLGSAGANTLYKLSGSTVQESYPLGSGYFYHYDSANLLAHQGGAGTYILPKSSLVNGQSVVFPSEFIRYDHVTPATSFTVYHNGYLWSYNTTDNYVYKMSLQAAPNAPAITSGNAGQTYSEPFTLSWSTPSHPAGVPITGYTVNYVYAGMRFSVASDTTANSLLVDPRKWPSGSITLEVIAKDANGGQSDAATAVITVSSPLLQRLTGAVRSNHASATYLDYTKNGNRWLLYRDGTVLRGRYTTGPTNTWAAAAAGTDIDLDTQYYDYFIDADDYLHLTYTKNANAYLVYYRRGTPNAARTGWTWSAEVTLSGTNSSYSVGFPTIVAHKEGTGWVAHILAGFLNSASSQNGVYYWKTTITSAGSVSATSASLLNTGTGGANWPMQSLEFRHTGDGKTVKDGKPDLFFTWTPGSYGIGSGFGIHARAAFYANGVWTWQADSVVEETAYALNENYKARCRWDGNRVIIGHDGYNPPLTPAWQGPTLYEWDPATRTTVTRRMSAPEFYFTSGVYDVDLLGVADSGDVWMLFSASQPGSPEFTGYRTRIVRWRRATDTWEELAIFQTTASSNADGTLGRFGDRFEAVFMLGAGAASNELSFASYLMNVAPLEPLTVTATPETVLVGDPVTIAWQHNDPTGQPSPQKKYQLRWRKID